MIGDNRRLIEIPGVCQVAKWADHLPHIWDLSIVEMVVRSAKHVLKVCHQAPCQIQCLHFLEMHPW